MSADVCLKCAQMFHALSLCTSKTNTKVQIHSNRHKGNVYKSGSFYSVLRIGHLHAHSITNCTLSQQCTVYFTTSLQCTLPQHYKVYTTTALHSVHHHSSTHCTSLQCTSPQQYSVHYHVITVYITTAVHSVHYIITVYITTALHSVHYHSMRVPVCVCVRVRLCVRVCVSVCMHTDQCHVCINGLNSLTFWDIIFSNCICRTLLYVCIEYCI